VCPTGVTAGYKIPEAGFVNIPFHNSPSKLLTLTKFGSNPTANDHEIWTDGSYNLTQEVGVCAAAGLTKGPLEGVTDIRVSGVDHCTSSTLAELHGLNLALDWAQLTPGSKQSSSVC